jgi:hypothetical protein
MLAREGVVPRGYLAVVYKVPSTGKYKYNRVRTVSNVNAVEYSRSSIGGIKY